MRLWSTRNRTPLAPVLKGMYGIAFSPDGKSLAVSTGETIGLWTLPGGTPRGELSPNDRSLMPEIAFSPDGKTIATATEPTGQSKSKVLLWDVSTRQRIGQPWPGHRFDFSPDGKTLATDGDDWKGIVLWDLRTRRPLGPPLLGHT